jgi:hypothetical protein
MKASRPGNTLLQSRAREINSLMRAYVNLHYGHVQEGIPDWRERSARYLARVADMVAELRGLDSRTSPLPDGLAGTAYDRAGCTEVEGETGMAARRRGSAAETAAELAQALRTGDLKQAVQLHRYLTEGLDRIELGKMAEDPGWVRRGEL